MGTRGAVGFRVGGVDKVQYNHFDSYPEGLGSEVVKFLKLKSNTDKALLALAGSIVLISGDVKPTEAQKEMCRKAGTVDLSVSKQSEDDWYCLLRKAQGDLGMLKKLPLMSGAVSFLQDSLFCEYAYIINVDTRMLEVYRGFNKDDKAPGRYAALRGKGPKGEPEEYCGVRLVAEISFAQIRKLTPAELLKVMNKACGSDEDDEKKKVSEPVVVGVRNG